MKKRLATLFIVSLALMLSMVSAGRAFAAEELIVSAASSLTNAFQDLGKKFESKNPGVMVICNFAASGPLLQQIEQGAPVDVFASADQKTMDQAQEKHLIVDDSRRNFAGNELVLAVPKGSKLPIKSPGDLTGKEVSKIAVGKPETVPVGRYTQEALTNYSLWETLAPKFIYGDSVRQVLDYVARAEVDAGFVFATDAAVFKDKVDVVSVVEKHKPIVYPIAVISSSQRKELARRFLDFTVGGEGREVLSRYGFGKP
jgi:molybdate transport system substrate-binding protein